MAIVLDMEPGRAAIYTGADDDAPFTNPSANWNRLKFHSSAYYPTIVDTRTVTVNFPSIASNGNREHTYTLFAHGRGAAPVIKGKVTRGGVPINIAGHVPVQSSANARWSGRPRGVYARFIALGADDTNVILHEYAKNTPGGALAALSLDIEVHVWSEIIEDGPGTPPDEIDITTEYWKMGWFDSRNPYLKENTVSPDFLLVAGKTLAFGYASNGAFSWGYKVGSYVVADYPTDGTTAPVLPSNTPVEVSY